MIIPEEQNTSSSSQERHELVGDRLKKRRQEQSLTLEEVAADTKISIANLRAIEEMAYTRLPADSFTKGQLVLYAQLLGMDGRAIADQFFIERDGGPANALPTLQKCRLQHTLSPKKLAEPTHVSSAAIASILLFLIVLSLTGFCWYFSWNPFAFLTGKTFSLPASINTAFHPADPATSNGTHRKNLHLQVHFRDDSRVVLLLDGNKTVEQTYAKGTVVQWEADKQIQLEFFRPGSAELQFNGSPLPFPEATEDGRYLLRLPPASTMQ